MFDRYGRGAQSSQTRGQGIFTGRRAPLPRDERATRWLEQAAASPDQFYGQLALERLGRTPQPPPQVMPPSAAERTAFAGRPLAEATRYLGMIGRRGDQTLFVRALAQSLRTERERIAAADFGRAIGRIDTGVWVAREARAMGDTFYARPRLPRSEHPRRLPAELGAGAWHHAAGKFVRSRRGQLRERAGHDAADAGHGGDRGAPGRRSPTISAG